MKTVLFFRKEGFYPLELPVDEDLSVHAKLNPGTLRVEDLAGKILWSPPTTASAIEAQKAE